MIQEIQGDTLVIKNGEREVLAMAENILHGYMVITISGILKTAEVAEIFSDELLTVCTLGKKIYVDFSEVEQTDHYVLEMMVQLHNQIPHYIRDRIKIINLPEHLQDNFKKHGIYELFLVSQIDLYQKSREQHDQIVKHTVLSDLNHYIQTKYKEKKEPVQSSSFSERHTTVSPEPELQYQRSLEDVIAEIGESFQQRLLHLIDQKGLTDVEVYKKANLNRRLFSKIRCNPAYLPKKKTAVALALALELSLEETVDLLARAELALAPSSKFDLIIKYCINHGIYDLYTVNIFLYEYNQTLLGE